MMTKLADKFRQPGTTEYDKILAQIEGLAPDCKSIFWYDIIPYTDRKKLNKEGFTFKDMEGHTEISW